MMALMKTDNWLKFVIVAGLFIVSIIPLIVSKSLFFPFITGKAFFFRFVVEIIFAVWLVLALRNREYRPKFSWVMITVLIFVLSLVISTILSENPFKSFWSNYERMEGFLGILHFVMLFVVSGSVLRTQSIWNKLLAINVGVSFIMAIYSLFQILGKITINQGGVRVDGTLGNASYLGIYMVFNIFFAIILFFRSKYSWQKILLSLVTLLNLIILYYTATRGSILGFLGGALVSLLYLAIKSEKSDRVRKIAISIFVSILVFVGLFFAAKDTQFVKTSPVLSRFSSLSLSDIQNQGRYFVWPIAWQGFLDRPIFGWGQESFNFVFNKYYNPKMYSQEPWFDRTHNVVLDWLVASGLFGLLSYVSIFIAVLYYIRKADENFLTKEDKAVMLGLLSAYIFHNLFVFDQIVSYMFFFLILAYIHSHSQESDNRLWQKISVFFGGIFLGENKRPALEALVLIALIGSMYFVVFKPLGQNKDLIKSLLYSTQGKIDNIDIYKRPIENYGMGFSEALEHTSTSVVNNLAGTSMKEDMKNELFATIDTAFKKQIERSPNDARYRLFYGSFLGKFGLYDRALEQLDKSKELSPNKQSIYFERVNAFLMKGDGASALSEAKKAYELEKNYEEAKIVYALTALSVNNLELYNQLIEDISNEKLIYDDRFISILAARKDFAKVIEIIKIRIANNPANIEYRITLAAAYLQAGNREAAISVIQEIIKINPSFKERGEYYINEIKAGRNP